MTALRHQLRTATFAAVLTGLALIAVAQVMGARAVPVLSGSMTPYASRGSLVLTVPVAGAQVHVGDVVAFLPPAPYARDHHPVMHRVQSVDTADGAPSMTTRGDANPEPDPWRISLEGADLGRVLAVLPWAGWLVMAGPGPAVLLLVGGTAAAEGARLLRRPSCSCSPAASAEPAQVDAAPAVAGEPVIDLVTDDQVIASAPSSPASAGPTDGSRTPTNPTSWIPAPRRPSSVQQPLSAASASADAPGGGGVRPEQDGRR